MSDPAVRLVHFSDVHLTARRLGWSPRDLATKRLSGWVNMRLLGRARRFRHAPEVVAAMMRRLRETLPDGLIFSGDATKLGFPAEFAALPTASASTTHPGRLSSPSPATTTPTRPQPPASSRRPSPPGNRASASAPKPTRSPARSVTSG